VKSVSRQNTHTQHRLYELSITTALIEPFCGLPRTQTHSLSISICCYLSLSRSVSPAHICMSKTDRHEHTHTRRHTKMTKLRVRYLCQSGAFQHAKGFNQCCGDRQFIQTVLCVCVLSTYTLHSHPEERMLTTYAVLECCIAISPMKP